MLSPLLLRLLNSSFASQSYEKQWVLYCHWFLELAGCTEGMYHRGISLRRMQARELKLQLIIHFNLNLNFDVQSRARTMSQQFWLI